MTLVVQPQNYVGGQRASTRRVLTLVALVLAIGYLLVNPTPAGPSDASNSIAANLLSDSEYAGLGAFASTMQVRPSIVLTTSTTTTANAPGSDTGSTQTGLPNTAPSAPAISESTSSPEPPPDLSEQENLALIAGNSTRNTMFDDNPYRDVPMSQISIDDLTVTGDQFNEVLLDTSNSGYFRVTCEVSHFAYDDPIVHPNQPGQAHLHMFFGNTEANAYSTYDSLLNTGTSTCTGEDLNRSAYWVPAMLNANGDALIPSEIIIYYKNHNFWDSQQLVKPFPENLRMVAGRAAATTPQTDRTGEQALPVISFSCGPAYQWQNPQPLIPECSGDALEMNIAFPACHNPSIGSYKLDQSHVSHPTGGYYQPACPDSHPYDLSSAMYRIFYRPKDYGGRLAGLRLSSDISPGKTLPGGTTSHGDWYGAWHPEAMSMWVENCNNKRNDCEIGLLQRDPDLSLKPHKRGHYPAGYLASANELIKLCPGKEIEPGNPIASAYCRTSGHS